MGMKIDYRQQLKEALLDGFSTKGDLEVFVSDAFGTSLDQLALGTTLPQIMSGVVSWAVERGRVGELAEKASRSRSGNPELQKFCQNVLPLLDEPQELEDKTPGLIDDKAMRKLVDRNQEWALLRERLESLWQSQGVGGHGIFQFYGMCGLGKTELLLAVAQVCSDNNIANVYIHLADHKTVPRRISLIRYLSSRLVIERERRNLNALIAEYDRSLQSLGGPFSWPGTSGDGIVDLERKIEAEFEFQIRLLLQKQPLVLILDGMKHPAPTDELWHWLEDLYIRVQSDRLLLILGGRKPYIEWNGRRRSMRAHDPKPLELFSESETGQQCVSIEPRLDMPAWGAFIHGYTHGHPASNRSFVKEVPHLQPPSDARDVARFVEPPRQLDSIQIADLTRRIIGNWLEGCSDRDRLERWLRALAPLRTFDRAAAKALLSQMDPDLLPEGPYLFLQTQLSDFVELTVLEDSAKTHSTVCSRP